MKKINWDDVTRFNKDKFSEDPDKHAEPELIYRLNFFRIKLKEIMRPSPVTGALARFDGSDSQHTVKDNQKSRASDMFPEGIPFKTYNLALSLRLFNGLGIYLDTIGPDGKPWVMFHFDIRCIGYDYGIPLIWICTKTHGNNNYFYPQYDSKRWELFKDERLYRTKKFGI